jgi:DnaJ-class molecular chaperone
LAKEYHPDKNPEAGEKVRDLKIDKALKNMYYIT